LRELFDWFWKVEPACWKRWLFRRCWALLLWSAALSLALTSVPLKLQDGSRRLMSAARLQDDVLVQELTKWRHRANWIYTSDVIYAFHARIAVPPELAVVPRKRFASGQINQKMILEIVKRYEPEILLMSQPGLGGEWREYLEADYKPIGQFAQYQLFLRRDVIEEQL
jgi:hypothetical protein